MKKDPFRERMLDKLDESAGDKSLPPAKRESARRIAEQIRAVWEKRAVMYECPALCLMEIARTAATGNYHAMELACRYTNRDFWDNEAFCREALKASPEEASEWVNESILKKWEENKL